MYKHNFTLQISQPYCLTSDFKNNKWTPSGTYWEPVNNNQKYNMIGNQHYNKNIKQEYNKNTNNLK